MNTRQHASSKLGSLGRSHALRIEALENRRLLALIAEMVSDINPGATPSYPSQFVEVNGTLYFGARDARFGWELWKTDGSSAGTVRVKHFGADWYYQPSGGLANVDGLLFFWADNGVTGKELWRSDGTATGTILIKDILPGRVGLSIGGWESVNDTLFFSVRNGVSGQELWKSDGSTTGTVRIKSFQRTEALTIVGDALYIAADDGVRGMELWKSDGTESGTTLVQDIHPGSIGSNPAFFANVGGTLYFSADEGVNGTELWKSDGTAAGTQLVRDIDPGSHETFQCDYYDDDGDCKIGHRETHANSSNPWWLTVANGRLFFATLGPDLIDYELWTSDGTAQGTVRISDGSPQESGFQSMGYLTYVNGTLFFMASDGVSGQELWKSDGTEAGTTRVRDIITGVGGSSPRFLTNVNGTLFFTANDDATGEELWSSDGTEVGTLLVRDIWAGPSTCARYDDEGYCVGFVGNSNPSSLTNFNGTLYFTADDGIHGRELWKVVVDDEATPGDTNGDGEVGFEDLINVRNHFGESGDGVLGDTAPFDGKVDIQDLNAVRNNFGTGGGGAFATRTSPDYRAAITPFGVQARVEPSRAIAVAALFPSDTRPIAARAADVVFGAFANHASPTPAQKPLARRHFTR